MASSGGTSAEIFALFLILTLRGTSHGHEVDHQRSDLSRVVNANDRQYADYSSYALLRNRHEAMRNGTSEMAQGIDGVSEYLCPSSIAFKTNNERGKGEHQVPAATSVHGLKPSDIRVVGAMGDSLTAAVGAAATTLAGLSLEYRGLAFPIGGDNDIQQQITLPNILRRFTSDLVGPSRSVGPAWLEYRSQLNVAVSGATSADMALQAKELIRRIRNHPKIDFQNDWKLVTVYVGSNDLCMYCDDKEKFSPTSYLQNIKSALDVLYEHLPKVFVSIVPPGLVHMLRKTHEISQFCMKIHRAACPSLVTLSEGTVRNLTLQYHEAMIALEMSTLYSLREDFAIAVQPYLRDDSYPTTSSGEVDLSFMALDCFHFSRYGHSLNARALWNNLLEPVYSKTTRTAWNPTNQTLLCPDPVCPYLRTVLNSRNCSRYHLSRLELAKPLPTKVGSRKAAFLGPAIGLLVAPQAAGENVDKPLPTTTSENTIKVLDPAKRLQKEATSHGFVVMAIGLVIIVTVSVYYFPKAFNRTPRAATETTPLLADTRSRGRSPQQGYVELVNIF